VFFFSLLLLKFEFSSFFQQPFCASAQFRLLFALLLLKLERLLRFGADSLSGKACFGFPAVPAWNFVFGKRFHRLLPAG
jgi:hypothetical protein